MEAYAFSDMLVFCHSWAENGVLLHDGFMVSPEVQEHDVLLGREGGLLGGGYICRSAYLAVKKISLKLQACDERKFKDMEFIC